MITESLAAIATMDDKDLDEGQRSLKYKIMNTRKSYIFQSTRIAESKDKAEGKKYEIVKETVEWAPNRIIFKDMTKEKANARPDNH
jgi:hypothetical protein